MIISLDSEAYEESTGVSGFKNWLRNERVTANL